MVPEKLEVSFLIQNISGLKKPDARSYLKDLLDSGGQVTDVTDWLQLAGSVLRKHNIKSSDTAGAMVDAVGDAAEWVVDAIEDGVDAIIDAVMDKKPCTGPKRKTDIIL